MALDAAEALEIQGVVLRRRVCRPPSLADAASCSVSNSQASPRSIKAARVVTARMGYLRRRSGTSQEQRYLDEGGYAG